MQDVTHLMRSVNLTVAAEWMMIVTLQHIASVLAVHQSQWGCIRRVRVAGHATHLSASVW